MKTPPPRPKFLLLSGALALLLLVLTVPAWAGVGVWTPVGPHGGSVHALLVDPTDPRIVYAGTQSSAVFRSVDGGETWRSSSLGLSGAVWVRSLAADPRRPGTVYAGTRGWGVGRSADYGRSWTYGANGLPLQEEGGFQSVVALVVDPVDSGWIYAATPVGLFASADGGANWQPRGSGLPRDMAVTALAAEPRGGRLWVGLSSGEIFTSTDRGASWRLSVRGLPLVLALAADPDRPGVVVAGTERGIYRTANGGRPWARVGAGTLPGRVGTLTAHASGHRIYAASRGVFFSRDGGLTWQRAESGPSDPMVLAFAAAPGNVVYAGTRGDLQLGGVFRSQDAGRSWRFRSRGLSTLKVPEMAVDPADPDRLFAVVPPFGIFRSSDRGANWTRPALPQGTAGQLSGISRILIDPARPSTIYVPLHCSLLRSDDGGDTWRRVAAEPGAECWDALALDPRAPEALWGAKPLESREGLAHSADGGVTWTRWNTPPSAVIRHLVVNPDDPDILYAGGSSAGSAAFFFRSPDGGQTWESRPLGSLAPVIQLILDPGAPGTLYANVGDAQYRSTDDGNTWEVTQPWPFRSIAASPLALYASSQGGSVLRSTDGGQSWSSFQRGLGWRVVLRLVVDPHDPRRLYGATDRGGIYTYTEPE